MEILLFIKFVFILALGAARRLEVESNLGLLAIFNLDWTVLLSESPTSTGEPVAEVISTAFFSCSCCFFACQKLSISWQSTEGVNRYTSHTAHFTCSDAHILSAHCTWCHTPHLWLKRIVSFVKTVIPSLSLAQCLRPCTEHAAHLPHPFPLFQVFKGCSHPEIPALIHENPGVTDTLIQNATQKRRKDVSSDVSGPGGSWTTTPPSAHADRSFDVSRWRVEKVAPGAKSCENQRSGTVLKCVKKNVLHLVENVEIDGTLVANSRYCFAQGIPHHHGLQLLSAEMDRWQLFSRSCSSKLQRFHRWFERVVTAHAGAYPTSNAGTGPERHCVTAHPSRTSPYDTVHLPFAYDVHAPVRVSGIEEERSCPTASATSPLLVGRNRSFQNWSVYQDKSPRWVGPHGPGLAHCVYKLLPALKAENPEDKNLEFWLHCSSQRCSTQQPFLRGSAAHTGDRIDRVRDFSTLQEVQKRSR